MKIQRYPGKAVDASLSLDRNNVMVELYEANWYHAHQNFGQPRTNVTQRRISNGNHFDQQLQSEDLLSIQSQTINTNGIYSGGSYLKDGVSTLSKYQMNLEQVRALERQSQDESVVNTLKDLNGYKPSTLKRKSIRLNLDWDDSSVVESALTEKDDSQNISHASGYGTEKRQQRPRQQISIKPPSLKRSQTMIYSNRASNPNLNNMGLKNNKNILYSQSSSSSLSFHHTPDEVSKTNPTVISEQPQPQKTNNLSTTSLPANTCDSNLRTFATDDQHSNQEQRKVNPQPRSPTSTTVNRSKSVRFPVNTQRQHAYSHVANYNGFSINTMTKTTGSRKISLDVKQDSYTDLLGSSFEKKLHLNSQTPTTLHVRQGSDSSTSSVQSSSTSSKSSQQLHDHFVIPRPRLIVPVHTYARKRRTGNLKDQDIETINNEDSKTLDGKTFWLNSFTSLNELFLKHLISWLYYTMQQKKLSIFFYFYFVYFFKRVALKFLEKVNICQLYPELKFWVNWQFCTIASVQQLSRQYPNANYGPSSDNVSKLL